MAKRRKFFGYKKVRRPSRISTAAKVKRSPSGYVERNIKEERAIGGKHKVYPGTFVRIRYNRFNPEGKDKPKIRIERIIFVLKKFQDGKLHALDISEFSVSF